MVWKIEDYVLRMGMHGKPGTNNTAELSAVLAALWWLSPEVRADTHIKIYADSEYAIGVLTQDWRLRKNQELIYLIRELISQFGKVEFVHVKGHEGEWGNEEADRLAGEARLAPDQAKSHVVHASLVRLKEDGSQELLLTSESPSMEWETWLEDKKVRVTLKSELSLSK